MITQSLDWSVGYTTDPCIAPKEFYNAAVPGSVQSDYAKAMHLPPYHYETNFSEYDWMEDMYWIYKTTLFFHLCEHQAASLTFRGIDYRYTI